MIKANCETPRSGRPLLRAVRQNIESVNQTLKGQLDLEHHGGRTAAGVAVRILQRILAMTAAIRHNWHTGKPRHAIPDRIRPLIYEQVGMAALLHGPAYERHHRSVAHPTSKFHQPFDSPSASTRLISTKSALAGTVGPTAITEKPADRQNRGP
ncbi:hypothetical protein [Dactylosporangium sp. NPDC051484]|uniref:hypothetical protein n=1 Tax=Dactylosporangium sp. NPDC051484 TaxID=3154942 RepID=UPI00344F236E